MARVIMARHAAPFWFRVRLRQLLDEDRPVACASLPTAGHGLILGGAGRSGREHDRVDRLVDPAALTRRS